MIWDPYPLTPFEGLPLRPPRDRKAGVYRGGKAKGKRVGESHAQVCPGCRVTLSRGTCLNRMCKWFDRRPYA